MTAKSHNVHFVVSVHYKPIFKYLRTQMLKLTERECPVICPVGTFMWYTLYVSTHVLNWCIILQCWVGFDQLLANMGVLLACRALGVDRYQSHDGLHNPCLDSFCDGTCVYRVNGSLGQGIQGWYLEGEILLIIASNSRYWFGGQRHTTVGSQFLIVVEKSKRMNIPWLT